LDITEIASRLEILDVIGKYAWYCDARLESDDHARLAELAAGLFTEDGVYKTVRMDGSEQVCRGRENIRDHFGERRAGWVAASEARETKRYSRHHVTPLMIEFETPDRAHASSYVAIIGISGLYNWGRYLDTFVLESSGWKFAERIVHVEGGPGPS
jgi:hypothetical protein